jgi:hypothetical protein
VTESTPGSSTARVSPGQTYEIRLSGLAAADCRWQWEATSDARAVRVEKQLSTSDPGERPVSGWSADEVFQVTPRAAGTHVVRFRQRCSRDPDADPQAEHVLTLRAEWRLHEGRGQRSVA